METQTLNSKTKGAPADVQPAAQFAPKAEEKAPPKHPMPFGGIEWLASGRRAECIAAYRELLATGGKDITSTEAAVIGAAVICSQHTEDLSLPYESFAERILDEFAAACLSPEGIEEALEHFRQDLDGVANIGEAYRKNSAWMRGETESRYKTSLPAR